MSANVSTNIIIQIPNSQFPTQTSCCTPIESRTKSNTKIDYENIISIIIIIIFTFQWNEQIVLHLLHRVFSYALNEPILSWIAKLQDMQFHLEIQINKVVAIRYFNKTYFLKKEPYSWMTSKSTNRSFMKPMSKIHPLNSSTPLYNSPCATYPRNTCAHVPVFGFHNRTVPS